MGESEQAGPSGDSTSQDELREKAKADLRWVIEESGEFPDLPELDQMTDDQVVPMGGGVDAATYLVKCPDRDVVVKLNSEGLEAEARALRAWKPYTERVPEVLGLGTVPSSEEPPIKYLLLPALKNDDGDVVETAKDYLERSPEDARDLGRAVGVERASATSQTRRVASVRITAGAPISRTSLSCMPTSSNNLASTMIKFRQWAASLGPVPSLQKAVFCTGT